MSEVRAHGTDNALLQSHRKAWVLEEMNNSFAGKLKDKDKTSNSVETVVCPEVRQAMIVRYLAC